jgi:hypothetical protein
LCGGSQPARGGDAQQGNGAIIGTVTDDKDKPVTELPLRLYVVEHPSVDRAPKIIISRASQAVLLSEKLITSVKTDKQGKFKFSDVKPGSYLLRASRKNAGFIYQDVEVKPGQTTDLGTIKLAKP